MNQENVNKLVDWMKVNQNNYSTEELKKTAMEGGASEEDVKEALNIINAKVGVLEYKGVGVRFFAIVIDYIIIVSSPYPQIRRVGKLISNDSTIVPYSFSVATS